MDFLGKKFNSDYLKNAALVAKEKLATSANSMAETANQIGSKAVELTNNTADTVRKYDYEGAKKTAQESVLLIGGSAVEIKEMTVEAVRNYDYDDAKKTAQAKALQIGESMSTLKEKTVDAARNFDLDDAKESAANFSKESVGKIQDYFYSTFEVDKSTFEMVEGIRNRLPTPAKSMDDIYDQCRNEAIRRAITAFMLGDILDQKSQSKYDKLTDSFQDYRHSRAKFIGDAHENYAGMKVEQGVIVTNAYNPVEAILHSKDTGNKVAVDHVTSRKEIFDDRLLTIGLTDSQLGDVINDKRNLAQINRSVNSQKSDLDLIDWLNTGDPHPTDPDKVIITIRSTGEQHVLDRSAVEEAYKNSKEAVRDGRIQAVKEITTTVVLTGATMAAQQIVGLIVVETIDVFMDELKRLKLVSSDGFLEELKSTKIRISETLSKRFEERDIWNRAKAIGMETGVSGALSVIPQILISLILKMPAFVYSLIRESTLSVVRSIRVLSSSEPDKLAALQVIMLGAATAVAGIYVQRIISQGITSVPLLNKFNSQVSSILSGLMITALPLTAIYTFDQYKASILLKVKIA